MSSPGTYLSINDLAWSGMRTYSPIASLLSGTKVKTLPESKSRSFLRINSRMPGSELSATAYPSTVSVGTVAILPDKRSLII